MSHTDTDCNTRLTWLSHRFTFLRCCAIDGPAAVARELDHEPDNYESTYLNRDASAVLFNSLAAVHITAAERMKQVRHPGRHVKWFILCLFFFIACRTR